MRLVIQRVLQAEVQVNENTVGKINKGCLSLWEQVMKIPERWRINT